MADLTSKVISSNFQRLLQIDSKEVQDGTGSATPLQLSGSANVGIGVSPEDGLGLKVQGSIKTSGDIIAENYIVSSSVTYMTQSFASGSHIFGDTIDDTHQFTGSLSVSGSLSVNGAESITSTTVTTPDSYLRKQYVKSAASISVPSTASFTAVTASAPTGLTATSEDDFIFFINGQYMEHDALTIKQAGSSLLLLVDTDSIGYNLESDDEIIASGKFNS